MSQLKNSQQMLQFLKDLSNFTDLFSAFQQQKDAPPTDAPKHPTNVEQSVPTHADNTAGTINQDEDDDNEKTPQSQTIGIADAFIQQILESYLKSRE